MTNLKTIKFQDGSFEMDVNVSIEDRTIWMNQKEIAELYDRSISTINEHIINILNEGYDNHDNSTDEQQPTQTVRCFGNSEICVENLDIKKDGKTRYYNLKIIILVGQRVRSNRGLLLKELLDKYLDETFVASYKILRFSQDNLELDVTVSPQEKTVWLTKEQIALLYDRDRSVISRHINNLYKIGELKRESTCAKNAHIPLSRNRNYESEVYNLDVILGVGYHVSGDRARQFREWTTEILKDHLIKGYSLNKNRLTSSGGLSLLRKDIDELKEDVADIKEKMHIKLSDSKLFFAGEYFDAREFICSLVSKANRSIILIDPFFDIVGLKMLEKCQENIDILLVNSERSKLIDEDVEAFEKQYNHINIIKDSSFHDRFLIIDETECYSLGTSLNYLGNKAFAVIKIESIKIIKMLIAKISSI